MLNFSKLLLILYNYYCCCIYHTKFFKNFVFWKFHWKHFWIYISSKKKHLITLKETLHFFWKISNAKQPLTNNVENKLSTHSLKTIPQSPQVFGLTDLLQPYSYTPQGNDKCKEWVNSVFFSFQEDDEEINVNGQHHKIWTVWAINRRK